jgi:hypothetical protein
MSLLNLTNDGNHSVLIVIFKLFLASKKALTLENIANLCAPGETGSKEKVRQTLNTWTDLGLFEVSSKEVVKIAPSIKKQDRIMEKLPSLLQGIVLDPENTPDLRANELAKAADFTRALSWLMAQDVWKVDLSNWDTVQALFQKQMGRDSGLIQNGTRWSGLKAWATYLGFAWTPRYPSSSIVIDPTSAIRSVLPDVFGKKKELKVTDFLVSLSHRIPVLDGGLYRTKVEDKLLESTGPDAWQPPPAQQQSTSLSRAILRLTADGSLNGELRDDSPERITLTGQGLGPAGEFSHFTKA